jgi:hypothetical protein
MKAGDLKKFYEKIIAADNRQQLNPRDYGINDNFLLAAIGAFQRGEPAEHLEALIDGFTITEELTVHRRTAVLNMTKDILVGLSKKQLAPEDRERLRSLLTAYFI